MSRTEANQMEKRIENWMETGLGEGYMGYIGTICM